ncbi:GyrI-like domain-containing protein [Nitratireductor thuwali]|uniref:GyrI-like small molecule binding domain-containing protein n=1 Tax=Nitratireductor thuwali TaxID=2267699 RepID=A0ABY5MEB4_9HYPH|nr:hypothetical protein NTH_00221 [Nitratireductor thuwali]
MGSDGEFELVWREPQRLAGKIWQGSYRDAAEGRVKPVIGEMAQLLHRLDPGRKRGGVIGISWNDIEGGFRYLAALPPALADAATGDGIEHVELPQTRLATAWHGAADGDVFAHYERMFAWIEAQGLRRVNVPFHHREEYSAGIDLDAPPELQLMAPVAG